MKKSCFLICLIFSLCSFSQTNFEGKITYGLTFLNLPDEMEAIKAMFPKESTVEISNGVSRSEVSTGIKGKKIVLTDLKTGKMILLMDVMGRKIASESTLSEKTPKGLVVTKTNETKDILGYDCSKAIVKYDEIEIVVFYTDKLPTIAVGELSYGIVGFPMEIQLRQKVFTLVQTVREIEEGGVSKISMSIPEGYQLLGPEEIEKALNNGM